MYKLDQINNYIKLNIKIILQLIGYQMFVFLCI